MNRGGDSRSVLDAIVLCMLWGIISTCPASASITTTGNVSPTYDGNDPWILTSDLTVGQSADASILVSGGSQVQTLLGPVIAPGPNVTASVTVTGTGSVWDSRNRIDVGKYGNGTMTIENGAHLVSREVFVASRAGSVGRLVVTGPGTTWDGHEIDPNWPSVFGPSGTMIGGYGPGEVIISDGARVTTNRLLTCLGWSIGGAGSLTVTDPNSLWENAGYMVIGRLGTGSLLISNGGIVTSGKSTTIAPESASGSATVTGPGSMLQIGDALIVGTYGKGELLVSDGGRVESAGGRVGTSVAGQYAVATVTGPGSDWLSSEVLNIGHPGRGRLKIEDGGHVTCIRSDVGWDDLETGIVEVRGAGSAWDIAGRLVLGGMGTGTMYVEDGGRVTTGTANVGGASTGVALVVVDGPGSVWSNTGSLYLGGGDATLRILHEGLVEANDVMTWPRVAIEGDGTLRTGMLTMVGTIRPGNSIGTLTLDGNLTMEPNSVLEAEIDNSGHGDKLALTGDVSIVGGTVQAVPTETITQSRQYTIVEANSVSGTFDSVVLPDAIARSRLATLSYEADSVSLTVTPFDGMPCLTRNQQALGTAMQTIADAGPTPVTAALQQLPTLDAVRAAYDQLSGQSRPALAPVAATDSAKFMGIVSNRLQGARGIVANSLDSLSDSPLLAMASSDERVGTRVVPDVGWGGPVSGQDAGSHFLNQDWGLWAKAYGLYGDRDTEHGTPGYSYNVFGQSFGVDIQFTERFIGGLTGGYSSSRVDYDRLADKADIDTTHAGLYGSYSGDGWYLNYVATHSWLNLDTLRVVDLTGERHKGSFDGYEWSGYFEAGFDWQPAPTWLVQPLAGLQVTSLHLDQYAEEGLASALVFEEQDYESYKASLGARVTKELVLGSHGRAAIVQGRARWVHEFGDASSSVNARFEDVPTVWFKVSDEEVSRDAILLGTGIGIRLTKGLRAFVDYDTSLNADNTAHVISGAVEYRW